MSSMVFKLGTYCGDDYYRLCGQCPVVHPMSHVDISHHTWNCVNYVEINNKRIIDILRISFNIFFQTVGFAINKVTCALINYLKKWFNKKFIQILSFTLFLTKFCWGINTSWIIFCYWSFCCLILTLKVIFIVSPLSCMCM